ncbi:oligosaccharide flippase family protein [Nitratiruptor sp. YY09-18]|uniref:oligosaccharide flippase family protein n=1 Tax=Nitratiruptor sp. YY09-18 TaxID=2724901 RepID=UPI0019169FBF|nr:oligosaccharide flippase family protein [Nitratiruptor sp. YY09-18]BCD67941.1 hypothetical protein NitYY0918_C0849 [Nitratiruptor sp. YY09-18]
MKRALSSLFLAEALSRALSFFIIIYVSRVLGATELGYWSYALAINAFLIIATNLGLDVYAMVEATKDIAKREKLYINTITIKMLLTFVALGLLWSLYNLIEIKVLLLITTLLVADLLSSITPVWYYQVAEDFKTIATIKITQAISYFLLAILLLWWQKSIIMLAVAYLGAYLVSMLIYGRAIFKRIDFSSIEPHHWHKILKVSLYLGGALFLNQIYTNTDKIMIAHMLGVTYNGYYEAGYKLYAFVPVIFSIIWTVFAPKVAKEKIYFTKFAVLIVSTALFIAAIFYIKKEFLIIKLYGTSFIPTVELMNYFALSIAALGLSYIATSPLALFEKNKEWFWIVFCSFLLNISLNYLLIPTMQLKGAVLATVAAESMTALLGLKILYKAYKERE